VREGLGALIDATPGFRCVGRYRSMEDALEALGPGRPGQPGQPGLAGQTTPAGQKESPREQPRAQAGEQQTQRDPTPDVALLDINLPGMSGIEGIPHLKSRFPRLSILMLTVYDDDDRIFEALCAGACGYLLKKTPPARLLVSVKEAFDGGAPMSPEVARRVVDLFREFRPPSKADYELTPHEIRLLKLIADGHNFRSVASQFGISSHGVSFHMRRIYEKLQVHSKSEAVAKALRYRLLN
jgi:DNA-binding NarL/FixJ family response regulator